MPAHDRDWIAPGTYRDGDQIVSIVRIGSSRHGKQRRERRVFPADTPLHEIAHWRIDQKEILIDELPAVAAAGSLAAAIPTFLNTLPANRYKRDSAAILDHWKLCPLGAKPIRGISRLDLVGQITKWIDDGAAKNTCNKRLSRLRVLYHALFTVDAPNPTDKIRYRAEPDGDPRDLPIRIAQLIIDTMPDQGRPAKGQPRPVVSRTKLRLRVMVWTGMQGATIGRIQPAHLDLDGGRLYLTARRKGKGTPGKWIAILPQAVDALRAFVAAGLLGKSWSNSSVWKSWQTAIERAKPAAVAKATETSDPTWITDLQKLPADCTPYDLRHTFGAEMYTRTRDLYVVKELLQHAKIVTTEKYAKGAVSARVTAAIAQAAATFDPPAPAPPLSAPPVAIVVHAITTPAAPAPRPRGALRLVR